MNKRKGKTLYSIWLDDYERAKLFNALKGYDEKILLEVLKEVYNRGDLIKS
jgi:hypothetical protein